NPPGVPTIGAVIAKILDHEFIPRGSMGPGDEIISINDHPIRDGLDVIFYAADEELEICLRRSDGGESTVVIAKPIDRHLGVELVPDKIRVCRADCDFCFIRQQPKKRMRRALYIKDDDYRLSFLHGNFITLTNFTPEDYDRIFEQRLSPLYVSVHATDDDARRRHLSAPSAPPIMEDLRRLIDKGIMLHTQNVIVPGINDGAILDRTLNDLANLFPDVLSIGVVPVGLTKYREGLPEVRMNTPEQGKHLLRQVDRAREKNQTRFDDPLIYAADELFILAGEPIPPGDYYQDYPQLENGIGLLRRFLEMFEQEFDQLPDSLPAPRHLIIVTGRSAARYLRDVAARITGKVQNLTLKVHAVPSEFWGEMVTVSGLLTGGRYGRRITRGGDDRRRGYSAAGLSECRGFVS
ncbi:DUF512 domain-containing protein, partial [Candidatus Zixiibacteriota bacterium]